MDNLDDAIKNNTILCKKAISLSWKIQEHLNKDILKEGEVHIIMQEYEWLREVMSLLSKHSNLFESCILLLENNMEQEAYILARSQFNNMLWISYICNGQDNSRVKEYFYEQHITKLLQLNGIKNYLKHLSKDAPYYDEYSSINVKTINTTISNIKETLRAEGYQVDKQPNSIRNKKIIELTEFNPVLLGLYNTFYNESSKYEHADIATTSSFRKSVDDDVSTDSVYKIDMGKSDISLWKKVMSNTLTILFLSIDKIFERLKNNEQVLF